MRILTAIVTYNRCHLLSRCIDHVQVQTRPTDCLVVINNGSTDGTLPMLAGRGVDVISQDNVGSAGGWYRAIDHAMEKGFDAIWLMDDDGFPDAEALAQLEEALVPEVACASSIVVQEDRPDRFVFPFPVLDKDDLPIIFAKPRKMVLVDALRARSSGGIYPFAHLFNGALVSVSSARTVGNVDRDFFIFGDEVDFFFRLRTVGKVCSVLKARHYHPDVTNRPYTPMKVYYYIKNTIILNKRYFNAVWLRHCLTLGAALSRTARRNGIGEALSYIVGHRAPIFYRAIWRGLQGRLGADFNG